MPSGWSESCREQRRFRNLQVCTSQKYSAVPARLTHGTLGINQLVDLAGVALRKIGGAKRKRRSVTVESRIPDRDHQFWYADCGSCTKGSTRGSEAAGQAPGGPNRPETSKNESKRNRSTQKSSAARPASGSHTEAATRGRLQLGGVTCGTLDRRSRAPDTLHYLLMACLVGGPNLVTNSVGFEIYKSVLKVQCCTHPPHTRYAWNQSTC